MTDRITIRLAGMTGTGFHGVLPEERRDGQRFVVAVELDLRAPTAASTDDLADTIDYRRVAAIVRDVIEGPPVDLLERLGAMIAERILEDDQVSSATVTIEKPELRLPLGALASVTVRRSR